MASKGIELGDAWLNVVPSFKGIQQAVAKELGAVDVVKPTKGWSLDVTKSLGGAFSTVGKVGTGAIAGIGGAIVALAAKGGFSRALNIENAQAKLTGLGHSTESVQTIMDSALKSVKGTAYGLGDAASVAASAVAAGIKPGDDLTRTLKLVGDAAQIAGTDMGSMGAIFNKVAASGKLQGEVIAQLGDRGVPILQLVAEEMGVTAAEVSKLAADGKVDFDTFRNAIENGMGGAALKAGETFTGSLANVRAAISRIGEMAAGPALTGMRDIFNASIPAVDAFATALKPVAADFKERLEPAVRTVTDRLGVFTKGMESGEITLASMATQVGQTVAGFMLLGGAGGALSSWDTIGATLDGAQRTFSAKFTGLVGSAKSGREQFMGVLNTLRYQDLRSWDMFEGEDVFARGVTKIQRGLADMSAPFRTIGSHIKTTMAESWQSSNMNAFFTQTGDSLKGGFAALGDKISGFMSPITSRVGSAFSAIGSKVSSAASTVLGPIGNVFGGIGDVVGGPLKSGLDKLGSSILSFFSPGNFLKFFAFGAIAAGLVAGLGAIAMQGGNELLAKVEAVFAGLPDKIVAFMSTTNLSAMVTAGSNLIQTVLTGITTALPYLASAGAQMLQTLVSSLAEQLPTLIPAAVQMITTLVTSLLSMLPAIIDSGLQLLVGLIGGIIGALPILIAAVPQIIESIITTLLEALPKILDTGVDLLNGIIDGLLKAIPQLVAMLPTIITTIVTVLVENLPQIIESGVKLLVALINGLVDALPQLIAMLPTIIVTIVTVLAENFPTIVNAGIDAIKALIRGLGEAAPGVAAKIGELPGKIRDALGNVGSLLWESGRSIISGLVNGISSMAGAAKEAVRGVLSAARNLLPFSPAKEGPFSGKGWTLYSGRSIVEGLAQGVGQREGVFADAVESTLLAGQGAISDLSVPGLSGGSSLIASTGGDTYVISPGAFELDLSDLEQIRTLEEFLERLRVTANRRAGGVTVA